MNTGHPAVRTLVRVTPGTRRLSMAYDCTSLYTNMEIHELIRAADEALPQLVTCPGLERTAQRTTLSNPWRYYSKTILHIRQQTIPPDYRSFHGAIPLPEIRDIRLHQTLEQIDQ